MNYLLDTNILLIYLRDKKTRLEIESQFNPFGVQNSPIISIVSLGEIKSLALRNKWGKAKIQNLDSILNELIIADIYAEDLIEKYAEIDAFSQNKIPNNPLNMSARNMGKMIYGLLQPLLLVILFYLLVITILITLINIILN